MEYEPAHALAADRVGCVIQLQLWTRVVAAAVESGKHLQHAVYCFVSNRYNMKTVQADSDRIDPAIAIIN